MDAKNKILIRRLKGKYILQGERTVFCLRQGITTKQLNTRETVDYLKIF